MVDYIETLRKPDDPTALELAKELFPEPRHRIDEIDEEWCRQAIIEAAGKGEKT